MTDTSRSEFFFCTWLVSEKELNQTNAKGTSPNQASRRQSDSDEYWVANCQATLSGLKANRKGNRERRRVSVTSLTVPGNSNLTDPNSVLIPVIENQDLLRCTHCYRTFRTDVAVRHVDTCSRKTLLNDGDAPNSLGRSVATGVSTNQLRSRQFTEQLVRRLSDCQSASQTGPHKRKRARSATSASFSRRER
ncbi:hypothetical protein FGIG_03845 [Fasciola gigantica]|uniref:Uncharacterized protein n=1 Tax=Fasciola gigantica TaxID=46835 RepID=A0A504YTH8_FASGI|nr:hypothetical protein FGIG_03845 [Fasciola gigantica]